MTHISIFTPTFNRVKQLERLYYSLCAQTYKDFSWIIVDDGSTDDTRLVVKSWEKENILNIHYYRQSNGGKQRAYNKGISNSIGEIFICIDSDDTYVDSALEKIIRVWESIERKDEVIAISYLSMTQDGELIGTRFPNVEYGHHFDIHNNHSVYGDKGMAFHIPKLKKFRFPVFEGEKFTTEALLYNRMSVRYKTRYINECLEIKEYLKGGLSDKYKNLLIGNPKAAALYYREHSFHPLTIKQIFKSRTNHIRYELHAKQYRLVYSRNSIRDNLLGLLCLPLSYYLYFRDITNAKK